MEYRGNPLVISFYGTEDKINYLYNAYHRVQRVYNVRIPLVIYSNIQIFTTLITCFVDDSDEYYIMEIRKLRKNATNINLTKKLVEICKLDLYLTVFSIMVKSYLLRQSCTISSIFAKKNGSVKTISTTIETQATYDIYTQ